MGLRGGARPERQEPQRAAQEPQDPRGASRAGSWACAARTSTTPRRPSSTTGPARSSPTSGSAQLHGQGQRRSSSPSSTSSSDGWRQPGSSIKPINYADRDRRPDDDGLDDVHGRRDRLRRQKASPRPRPTSSSAARSASARRSSSRSTSRRSRPASSTASTTSSSGSKDFGLRVRSPARARSSSMGIGTLEIHPIDLLGAYGTIANGGVLMPRHTILKVARRRRASRSGRRRDVKPAASASSQRQAAYIITDILAGQHDQERQPVLGRVGGLRRRDRRPPGRLQDRHDERQPRRPRLRLPRPAEGQDAPGPRGRASGWATATTPRTTASSRSTRPAPLWSAILRGRVSKGMPIAKFSRIKPEGPRDREGRRVHRPEARAVHAQTVEELFIAGTEPTKADRVTTTRDDRRGDRPALAGRLRRAEGDAWLPRLHRGRGVHERWQKADSAWRSARRAAPASRAARRARGRRTSTAAGSPRSGGAGAAPFAPTEECPLAPPPAVRLRPRPLRQLPAARGSRRSGQRRRQRRRQQQADARSPDRRAGARAVPSELDDRRPVAALAALARRGTP